MCTAPQKCNIYAKFCNERTPGPMTKTELFLCKTELFPYKIQSHHVIIVINHKIKQMEKHCQQKKQQPTNLTSAHHPPPLQKYSTKDLWHSSSSKYADCSKEWQICFILDPTCLQISLPVEHCNLCKPPKCRIIPKTFLHNTLVMDGGCLQIYNIVYWTKKRRRKLDGPDRNQFSKSIHSFIIQPNHQQTLLILICINSYYLTVAQFLDDHDRGIYLITKKERRNDIGTGAEW